MADITNLYPELAEELRRSAAENYNEQKERIVIIRERIAENREGRRELLDVGDDLNRRKRRIDRTKEIGFTDAVERINGEADFQDVSIIHRLDQIRPTVCRIAIRTSTGATGFGSGFMIAPGLLMTNHHVLRDVDTAERSQAQFGYEIDLRGNLGVPVSFRLAPQKFFVTSTLKPISGDEHSGLDFTIVAVEPLSQSGVSLSDYGYVKLDSALGKIVDGERCIVIQHPKGDYKKVVLKDIRVITVYDDRLIYESDTNKGASGSPVIALGTGMVVALHHSAVPKIDSRGNYLRKDGRIWSPEDGDDAMAWEGNEGIRISRIMEAIKQKQIPEHMNDIRQTIFNVPKFQPTHVNDSIRVQQENGEVVVSANSDEAMELALHAEGSGMRVEFELLLTDSDDLVEDWPDSAQELVPGFERTSPLFPGCTENQLRRSYYLSLHSEKDPWILAEKIEQLPHVQACTPDLPMLTDSSYGRVEVNRGGIPTESAISELIRDDGVAELNEDEFLLKWRHTDLISEALNARGKYQTRLEKVRKWHQKLINWDGLTNAALLPASRRANDKSKIRTNLANLRFVQLDTGYTRHTKVYDAFDLDHDIDFVSNDSDARDEIKKWILKQPGHGTRTASISIGTTIRNDPDEVDGNPGILYENGSSLAHLIPFRIANSVVLLGRAKELVDAVNHAIENDTDIMFMCMGTYSKHSIELAAKRAYEAGIIWVCAAGNYVRKVIAPASCPGTIAVAALNPAKREWKHSSRGYAVDIAAGGEDIYVPNWDQFRNEIMSYGSGTSYATPQVASAAMLWKARWKGKLDEYTEAWQVPEAFRSCLKQSADGFSFNDKGRFGAGVMDITNLLNTPPPPAKHLANVYKESPVAPPKDAGVREVFAHLWNRFGGKNRASATESFDSGLTARGKVALDSMRRSRSFTESSTNEIGGRSDQEILFDLFDN